MKYEITLKNNLLSIHQDGQQIYQKDISGVRERRMYDAKALVIESALVMHTSIAPERCEDIALRVKESGFSCAKA